MLQGHTEVTLREGMVQSLHRATVDMVQYQGPHALASEIINKLELVYGTVASFHILMQNIYKVLQGKTEKVTMYVTQLEGGLNVVQQEYPTILSDNEVQQHLRDRIFHGLHKPLRDLMCYLYDDVRITYPQLVTAAWKAESEEEDCTGISIWVKSIQAEEKDDTAKLSEQIVQLGLVMQKPQSTAVSNPQQLGSENDRNGKKGKINNQGMRQVIARG